MWYKNSLVLTLTTVVLTLLVQLLYRIWIFHGVQAAGLPVLHGHRDDVRVPFEILMLPLYQEITKIGLVDSNAGVFLPGLCAAGTIFLRWYMTSPKELLDAARVDGWVPSMVSVHIMMPITKPAFASQAIMCAMGSWNNMPGRCLYSVIRVSLILFRLA